jgi:hypothetical protein
VPMLDRGTSSTWIMAKIKAKGGLHNETASRTFDFEGQARAHMGSALARRARRLSSRSSWQGGIGERADKMSAIWHEAEMLAGRLGGPPAEGKRTNPGEQRAGAVERSPTYFSSIVLAVFLFVVRMSRSNIRRLYAVRSRKSRGPGEMELLETKGGCRQLRVLLLLRGTIARSHRIPFAHVSAVLCSPVISSTCEMIDVGVVVHPNHGVSRTSRLSLGFR